jgi:anion-transporting  ArsA/GET3 family ATPase
MASRPFYQVADRVLGSRFLQDIAEFFILFQAMESGFVRHAREVEAILSDPRTTFVVVSTLEAAPTHEATYLARALDRRDLHLGAVVANRVLPGTFTSKAASQSARKMVKRARRGDVPAELAGAVGVDVEVAAEVVAGLGERFADLAVVASRERERHDELAELAPLVVTVPILDRDVNDLTDLTELARCFG